MDINTIQSTNPYLNSTGSRQADNPPPLSETNTEASRTDLDQESAEKARQAFNVTISQEARQLAAEKEQAAVEQNDRALENSSQNRQGNPLVNIIA